MIAFMALLAIAALSSSAAAQKAKTQNIQDMLPLAVGNSWTYQHAYVDHRVNVDGTAVFPQGHAYAEITISILRTEVIGGETYYVFSEGPDNQMPVDLPAHFIDGKKLRWDGNNLMEHDGTSAFSLYQFDPPVGELTTLPAREYTISSHGDTLVEALGSASIGGMFTQVFSFIGFSEFMSLGGWDPIDSRSGYWSYDRWVEFAEHWGVRSSGAVIGEDGDTTPYRNELLSLRATFYPETSGGRGSSGPVTVTREDYNCAYGANDVLFGDTCTWPPSSTSNSSASWGETKERR